MKNIAIIVQKLNTGGAERIAGLLSKELSKIYNIYLFLMDTDNINYDYSGTIVNLSINGDEYIEYYMITYKRKYNIDCSISFLEGMNFRNIRTREADCIIISERCSQSPINPPVWIEEEGIKSLYNYADKIISVSHGVKYDLVNKFGVDENLITTIYNLIDKKYIYRNMNEEIDKDILSFIGNSKVILNIGRLYEQKNHKEIIVQFSKLIYEGENVKLIIVGTGSLREELQRLIHELGLDNCVKIISYGKNPFPYYRIASLFVLASKYEGLPNVILEAMACGVPIVATDCLAGPRELLKDSFNYEERIEGYEVCDRGILVEQKKSEETGETDFLKEAMQMVLHRDEVRDKIIANGRRYMEKYSNEKILKEWVDVIENTEKQNQKVPRDIPPEIEKNKKLIIYGAGNVGKKLVFPYLDKVHEYELFCFAVSRKRENHNEIFGIPVFEIEELIIHKNDATVLIGVSQQYQEEVTDILNKCGFKNVIYPQYCKFNYLNYRYFYDLDSKEYGIVLSRWYRVRTGLPLNWNNLTTYNEKMQWLKLYDRIDEKRILSDKYRVRDYVQKKIGKKYLVPLLGCWDSFDEIDFETLPDEFILKCNHGSGWNYIVNHKEELNYSALKEQFDSWMLLDYAFCSGLEMNYKGIEPKIIAEEMLHAPEGEELRDYKVFVFDGEAKIIQVDIDRTTNHRRNLYTKTWEYIPHGIKYPMAGDVKIERPNCLDELLSLSEILGADFRHVRVDFYIVDNRIYFGEMTFSHGSGTEKFTSPEFALEMGSWIDLPEQ